VRRATASGRPPWLAIGALVGAQMLVGALGGCTVGPDYTAAAAPTPTHYKELKGWKVATPGNGPGGTEWWTLYRDPKLDTLIKQVEISNQTVAANAAAYEQARAIVREGQAALFPVVTGSYTATRTRTGPAALGTNSAFGPGVVGGSGSGLYSTTFTPQLSASWDLDVWGKVRRQIESDVAGAQVSAADLAFTKLSEQGLLATAYFNLRTADSLYDLYARTVRAYKKTLDIVQNQFKAGYSVTLGDVATARAQVETTEALQINVGVQRAQYEHAIAMLIGRPPAELTIGHNALSGGIPKTPVAVPSTLLERRPDISASERMMQEENALIGVATAAYYPDISLSALLEWTGSKPFPFSVANEIWSLGAAGTQTIFNGGLTGAEIDAAKATYWQSVANYRQTVLTAFQQVEDELVAIRLMTQQLAVQQAAVKDARQAVDVYLNQFQAGTIAFTTVVTAEITLLTDEQTELTIRQDLFLASVALIEALGGGWDANLLPSQKEMVKDFSLLPKL
jgi:NodT family efflux transporter outer membrane factor (OMF) lipoprotein